MKKRIDDARKAFVAAQKIDEVRKAVSLQIREISIDELKTDKENSWKGFGPKICSDCRNYTGIKERYFEISRCPETKEDEEQLVRLIKKQHGVEHFDIELDVFGDGRGLVNSAVCGNCGSQNVVLSTFDDMGYVEIKGRKKRNKNKKELL